MKWLFMFVMMASWNTCPQNPALLTFHEISLGLVFHTAQCLKALLQSPGENTQYWGRNLTDCVYTEITAGWGGPSSTGGEPLPVQGSVRRTWNKAVSVDVDRGEQSGEILPGRPPSGRITAEFKVSRAAVWEEGCAISFVLFCLT